MTKTITLATSDGKLILSLYTVADAEDIFTLIDRNRKHLSQFGDRTARKYKTLEAVIDSILNPPNKGKLRFAIRRAEDGVLVGTINLTPDEKGNFEKCEIGYYLGSEFVGNGYMTSATNALTAYAFAKLGAREVFAKIHKNNEASEKVIARAGFKQTGKTRSNKIFSKMK